MHLKLSSLSQDGFSGAAEAVVADPLQVADPDGHLREFVGVGVDLDPVELPRPDDGRKPPRPLRAA